jgi:peptidoglycan/xylan/chitin deacetylase (PgdA/CDA1 family)
VSYFLIGVNIRDLPSIPNKQLAAGHVINSHTMTHPSLITLTLANVAKEFNDARAQFTANTCIDPTLYRPPYGDTNANVQVLARKMGLRGVLYV